VKGIPARSIREGSLAQRQAYAFWRQISALTYGFLHTLQSAFASSLCRSGLLVLSAGSLLSGPSSIFVQPFNPFQPFFYLAEQGVGE